MSVISKIFGTHSEREIKKILPTVEKIEALSEEYRALSDDQLSAKTAEFKTRLSEGETLDELLPEAFATIREAAWRVLGLYAFHVQLIGGIVLHQGRIAEMKTGEGKTLVAIFPAYLNALTGRGVHIVTVNDYLASYQGELMGKVFNFLGMSVGVIINGLPHNYRKAAYLADITYGTNNQFGFDYLRDNTATYKSDIVGRSEKAFAIVDEIDSILIDEARTPLIISGEGSAPTHLYYKADKVARTLKKKVFADVDAKEDNDDVDADYIVNEKSRSASLTASGIAKVEKAFNIDNLSAPENSELFSHINKAIHAHGVMQRDVDYIIRDGQVVIVDQFTGRTLMGRRYSDGLHQAIEAKEGVEIRKENITMATITLQNYYRLYDKLSGMTGTAITEADEFAATYSLDVVEIPTNKPMIRKDYPDIVFIDEKTKFNAIAKQIQTCVDRGQPVLVGTVSVEKSELLSSMLKKQKIKHVTLNARMHEKEAEIVAQAGRLGAVTIATNMAGRGTDIMLGGNPEFLTKNELSKQGMSSELIYYASSSLKTDNEEILEARRQYNELYKTYKAQTDAEAEQVKALGGLFIIGTERHESRRIDNQLRGRAGRQGDPGESRFFISLDDDVLRLFGNPERLESSKRILTSLSSKNDEEFSSDYKLMSKLIEQAQKNVESRNFAARKHTLQYDDVINQQRTIIYEQRAAVLEDRNLTESINKMIREYIDKEVDIILGDEKYVQLEHLKQARKAFEMFAKKDYDLNMTREELDKVDYSADDLKSDAYDIAMRQYKLREEQFGSELMREFERVALLGSVDSNWPEHLDALMELREGVALRAYAQHDPVTVFKAEAFDMFEEMISAIHENTIKRLFIEIPSKVRKLNKVLAESSSVSEVKRTPRKVEKIGRNDPCPCGSGKKYKKCCGANQ